MLVPFVVDWWPGVPKEIAKELTERQMAQLAGQVLRLEKHGYDLGRTYFGKVKGEDDLWEFKVTVQNVDYRLLFADEQGAVIVLCGYKEKGNKIPPNKINTAKARLDAWRAQRARSSKLKK